MSNVRALNDRGATPEVVLEEIASKKPLGVLAAFIEPDGTPAVLFSGMTIGDLCYLSKMIDLTIETGIRNVHRPQNVVK